MSISELVDTFDQLMDAAHALSADIQSGQYKIWVPLTEQEVQLGHSSIKKAGQVFEDVWYQDGQDGRETRSSFGLIAADDLLINKANHVNDLKDALKAKVNQLQKRDKIQWRELKGELNTRHENLRSSLHFSGLARLHLKQTWRHIPVIDRCPTRVGFNWYNSGRSIQKITLEQAQKALEKMDISSAHIQAQLSALGQLRPNTPLAKVQNLAPVMRANVFFDDNLTPDRLAMNVSLPLLFRARDDNKMPDHNAPPLTPPDERQRAVRSDRRIEDDPFLPSIRVHRYIDKS